MRHFGSRISMKGGIQKSKNVATKKLFESMNEPQLNYHHHHHHRSSTYSTIIIIAVDAFNYNHHHHHRHRPIQRFIHPLLRRIQLPRCIVRVRLGRVIRCGAVQTGFVVLLYLDAYYLTCLYTSAAIIR